MSSDTNNPLPLSLTLGLYYRNSQTAAPPSFPSPRSAVSDWITSNPGSFSSTSQPSHVLHLPPPIIVYFILPYLTLRQKLLDVTHLSHSFPPLTPACFRHDHLNVSVDRLCRIVFSLRVNVSLSLVSSVSSVSVEGGWDVIGRRSDKTKARLRSSVLRCLSLLQSVVTLRLPYPDRYTEQVDGAGYLQQLLTSSPVQPAFAQLESLCLFFRAPGSDRTLSPRMALDEALSLCSLPSLTLVSLRRFDIDSLCCRMLLSLPARLTLLDLADCSWSDRQHRDEEVRVEVQSQLPHPSPTLRTLLLPREGTWSRMNTQHPAFRALLRAALSQLTYFDMGSLYGRTSAFEQLDADNLTALDVGSQRTAPSFLQNLHIDGKPSLPQLRHTTIAGCSPPRDGGWAVEATVQLSFLATYRAQLHTLELDLQSLPVSHHLWTAIFSCCQLRTLSLRLQHSSSDGENGDDEVMFSQLSSLDHLHSLHLGCCGGPSRSVGIDGLTAILSACPSLRRLTCTHLKAPTERVVLLAGQLCPHLLTLKLNECGQLIPSEAVDTSAVLRLSRPLFPALQAAFLRTWHSIPSLADSKVREAHEVADALRCVRALVDLLSDNRAPLLRHLFLQPQRQSIGDRPAALLRARFVQLLGPLTGRLLTLDGGMARWPQHFLPLSPRTHCPCCRKGTVERTAISLQQSFSEHVRSEAEVTVAEFVSRWQEEYFRSAGVISG